VIGDETETGLGRGSGGFETRRREILSKREGVSRYQLEYSTACNHTV
jgi:hypothetical protein